MVIQTQINAPMSLGDEEGISLPWHVVARLDFMAETYGIKASSFGQKCRGLQIQALLG